MCAFPDTVIRGPLKTLIVSYSHYLPHELTTEATVCSARAEGQAQREN